MKITAKVGPWSSVVGGGVHLYNEKGHMVGQLAFLCHDDTLRDREVQADLARVCCAAINHRNEVDEAEISLAEFQAHGGKPLQQIVDELYKEDKS